MRVHQILNEASPLDALIGQPAVILSKSGKQVKGTILGPSMKGTPGEVKFQPDGKQPFNIKADRLLDPKTRAPLKGAQAVSSQTSTDKSDSTEKSDSKTSKKAKLKTWMRQSLVVGAKENAWKGKIRTANWVATLINLLGVGPQYLNWIGTYILNGKNLNDRETRIEQQRLEDTIAATLIGLGSGTAVGAGAKVLKGGRNLLAFINILRTAQLAVPGLGWLSWLATTAAIYLVQKALASTDFVYGFVKNFVRPVLTSDSMMVIGVAALEAAFGEKLSDVGKVGEAVQTKEQFVIEEKPAMDKKQMGDFAKDVFKDAPPEIKQQVQKDMKKEKQRQAELKMNK